MISPTTTPLPPAKGVAGRDNSSTPVGGDVFVSVVVPVYNGEDALGGSIRKLRSFLAVGGYRFEIIIANNGSTDGTLTTALQLARALPEVRVMHLDQKGRGRAVKAAWSNRDSTSADILTYMDVDLSADITFFPALIEALAIRGYDLATGSRLLEPQQTTRCARREVISRAYNLLVKMVFHTRFSDAQCGFKAITARAAQNLLPLLQDDGWFMDTELLVVAEKLGYRIFDLPVRWIENPDSRVRVLPAAWQDLRGIFRLKSDFANLKYRI